MTETVASTSRICKVGKHIVVDVLHQSVEEGKARQDLSRTDTLFIDEIQSTHGQNHIAMVAEVAASTRREMALVDPRGTSQICSGCGRIVEKGLSVMVHSYPDPVRWSNRPALGHDGRYSARSPFTLVQ